MGMPQRTEKKVTVLDVRMGVAVFICFMISTICSKAGFVYPVGDRNLEIIQKMTSCIACLLCCQDSSSISLKAGINRIIITFIGGLVGILVIILDDFIGNEWILGCMVALGVVLTLFLCKAAKVPYINARIGGVTFILVTCTLQSDARIYYGMFRLVSTVFGVLVVLAVTWIFQLFSKKK
jgi:uncharacterized membrane protein YccC